LGEKGLLALVIARRRSAPFLTALPTKQSSMSRHCEEQPLSRFAAKADEAIYYCKSGESSSSKPLVIPSRPFFFSVISSEHALPRL
jgi:hypothetical protein